MEARRLCTFGAAFLLTVAAALFAPSLLLFVVIPPVFVLVLSPGLRPAFFHSFCLGCLAALVCCGLFALRMERNRRLVGRQIACTGTVMWEGGRQLAAIKTGDGSTGAVLLYPQMEDCKTGDSFAAILQIDSAATDSEHYFLSGGVLLTGRVQEALAAPEEISPPLYIRSAMLREYLCAKLLSISPAYATSVTAAMMFSTTDIVPQEVKSAFATSGMSHLLSVSGLHISILLGAVMSFCKKLRLHRWQQVILGICCILPLFLAAGMTASAFRAGIMSTLSLLAWLMGRSRDSITSLVAAAVALVCICPTAIADLSFLLSFLATTGIILLAPAISHRLGQFFIGRFGSVGSLCSSAIAAFSVTLSAQIFTLPVVAYAFGNVPLLGLITNLVAIPLCYPLLLLGFAACLSALLGISSLAALLLVPANLLSLALSAMALATARLPLCSIRVLFPADWLAVGFILLWGCCLPLIKSGSRHGRLIATVGTVTVAGSLGISLLLAAATATVVTTPTALIILAPGGSLVLDSAASRYDRYLDSRLLNRLGGGLPEQILLPAPDSTAADAELTAAIYGVSPDKVFLCDGTPRQPLPSVLVRAPTPYLTEIDVGNTKLMKYYAVYDTILKYGGWVPERGVVLADMAGNLLSPGGERYIVRRQGYSCLRLPLN